MELSARLAVLLCASVSVLAGLLAGGCGEAAKDAPPPPAGSQVQFQTIADSICAGLNGAIDESQPASSSVTEIVRHVPRNVSLERKGVREMSALKAPARIAHSWSLLLKYRRTLAGELDMLVQSARRNDAHAIEVLGVSKQRMRRLMFETAARLGLQDCERLG